MSFVKKLKVLRAEASRRGLVFRAAKLRLDRSLAYSFFDRETGAQVGPLTTVLQEFDAFQHGESVLFSYGQELEL